MPVAKNAAVLLW